MGTINTMKWQQKLAAWLERPLTSKREHQPAMYAGVHAVAGASAIGWTGFAVASTLGLWGLPVYGAIALAYTLGHKALRQYFADQLVPLAEYKCTTEQTTSRVLPVVQDIAQTYMAAAGRNVRIGFDENNGYYQLCRLDKNQFSLAVSAPLVSQYHNQCVDDFGKQKGAQQFILTQANIMAHEEAHMDYPWWHNTLLLYPALQKTLFIAAMAAPFLAYAGAITATAMALPVAALAVVSLSSRMTSRAEEYRADRECVEKSGTSRPLQHMFIPSKPSNLHRVFYSLTKIHPTSTQRVAAMQAHEAQLQPLEKARGLQRLKRLYTEIAERHAHLFEEKPAAANPPDVLTRVRSTSQASTGLV